MVCIDFICLYCLYSRHVMFCVPIVYYRPCVQFNGEIRFDGGGEFIYIRNYAVSVAVMKLYADAFLVSW